MGRGCEAVYNSNAIENSTLTLQETEKILLEMEVAREVSVEKCSRRRISHELLLTLGISLKKLK